MDRNGGGGGGKKGGDVANKANVGTGGWPAVMFAPGAVGEVQIAMEDLEKNPQAYSGQLQQNEKANRK